MSKSAAVFTRVEPELKEEAEAVLAKLGIPLASAVTMFLRQVVLQQGIPFALKLPLAYGSLSKEELDRELAKGLADSRGGRVIPATEVEAELRKAYKL